MGHEIWFVMAALAAVLIVFSGLSELGSTGLFQRRRKRPKSQSGKIRQARK